MLCISLKISFMIDLSIVPLATLPRVLTCPTVSGAFISFRVLTYVIEDWIIYKMKYLVIKYTVVINATLDCVFFEALQLSLNCKPALTLERVT